MGNPGLSDRGLGMDVNTKCPICESTESKLVFEYHKPPPEESQFSLKNGEKYFRQVFQCGACGHYRSVHEMKIDQLYKKSYHEANYGMNGLHKAFKRIQALPPESSDNFYRTKRVCEFTSAKAFKQKTLLDVGSNLGVFPYAMKKNGWTCEVVDPSPQVVKHASKTLGIPATQGDFLKVPLKGPYSLVTFNKVLEHVSNPTAMLSRSSELVAQEGIVYVEVPDGESASQEGKNREEFTLDHSHVFSFESLKRMSQNAGFQILSMERLQEPSSKYTLLAFLSLTESING
jgi:2-polyprenyl-3-methyl-5-hydroxy-6-metoxy-1,4-benzoquinol methylase